MDLTTLELGAGLLTLWAATFVVLWKLVDRPGRPGVIRGQLVIEHFLLAHIFLLIVAICLLIKGSGYFG